MIVATEPLAIMSAHPIQPGQILDLPYNLARSMVRAGLASKVHPYSLRVYPVCLPAASITPPIVVHPQGTHRKRIETMYGSRWVLFRGAPRGANSGGGSDARLSKRRGL